MQISLSEIDEAALLQMAHAAGFADVECYVTEHILALARHRANFSPRFLADSELEASLKMCDESMSQIDAGLGLTVDEAREAIHKRLSGRKG